MNTVIKSDKTLDVRGEPCSLVLLRIKKTLAGMQGGEILEVFTTDPCTEYDIPTWVKRFGNKLVKSDTEGDTFLFFIQTP
ncbi:MAG: hypothetical protein CO150_04490 [Nitrospirae bacterium CG_4_9_14_3_um_filter_53_35]|nr:MAG: hypothetical protein COZ95_10150 [Nitrospirae bacterium CG_4_8_14_3_um_filter_50_41]PJA75562.1 MAG: hypothetical protein CO150_04490 [Nitrospirae bacterium CG_4_9_14_3_um_filter_53_35]